MTKTVEDVQKFGRWLQRTWIGDEYTWTESGVMWNGIKRRTNDKFTEAYDNSKYVGAVNKFKSFDSFVEWVRSQVGYGMKYDLDSDILKPMEGIKTYSEDTCLLIPSNLNRFIQRSKGSEIGFKGVCFNNSRQKYLAQCYFENGDNTPKKISRHFENLDDAKSFYAEMKNKCAAQWLQRLNSEDYKVDSRVIQYMENWRFSYD